MRLTGHALEQAVVDGLDRVVRRIGAAAGSGTTRIEAGAHADDDWLKSPHSTPGAIEFGSFGGPNGTRTCDCVDAGGGVALGVGRTEALGVLWSCGRLPVELPEARG